MKILMALLFLLISLQSFFIRAESCGTTFNSFWHLNNVTGTLKLKQFYKHNDRYCQKSIFNFSNVEVQILGANKSLLREFKTYLPLNTYHDVKSKGQLHGLVKTPDQQLIQIKFANDDTFKKAKFIKILTASGKIYESRIF